MGHPSISGRLLRSALALAFVTGCSLATVSIGASAAAQTSAVTYSSPVVESAGLATHVPAGSGAASSRDRGARLPHSAAKSAAARLSTAANASSSSEGGNGGRLLTRFNGVSSLDSQITNFGATFEPPDQGLCAGNGFVLEPVNSAYTIYRTDGTPIAGPFNVNDLFHRNGLAFTSDPRCYYDASTNTWFATILFISTDANGNFTNQSTIDISVNPSGDPTKAWTTYSIDTSDAANTKNGCPCFGDQPRFGIDAFNLYLSADEFSILGPNYNGAQLYAVSKSDLVNLKHRIHFAHFNNPQISGSEVIAVEPATTNSPANAEYFIGALDTNADGNNHNQVAVWAMTNRDRVAQNKAPTLSSLVINSETYSVPPNGTQKSSTAPIVSNDDRMQQAQFINGTIWAELDTALNIRHDSTLRAAAAWFNVQPSLAGSVLGSATMTRQGYVALAGSYLLFPAVQADQNGNAAMVFTVTSDARFPSAAFTTMTGDQSNFGPIQVVAEGTGPYLPDPNFPPRWGDYSYASLDSATDSMWLATEYVPSLSSQTTTGINNWGTEVMRVSLGDQGGQGNH